MNASHSSVSSINHCRQAAQQLIQQTQQSNHQYQQMLQNEQQNIQILDQIIQREQMAVQTIQQSLQGHEIALQRCQEVINECNRLEHELSGQISFQPQQYLNPGNQTQLQNSFQYRQ